MMYNDLLLYLSRCIWCASENIIRIPEIFLHYGKVNSLPPITSTLSSIFFLLKFSHSWGQTPPSQDLIDFSDYRDQRQADHTKTKHAQEAEGKIHKSGVLHQIEIREKQQIMPAICN